MTAMIKEKVTNGLKQKVKDVGWSVVKTAALSAAITAGVSSTFPAIGFANGIVASSVVSIYQQSYSNGKISLSPFSLVTKIGVKGLIVATKVGITAATVATTGIYSVCKTVWNQSRRQENIEGKPNELKKSDDCCSEEEENEDIKEFVATVRKENTLFNTEWVNIECAAVQTHMTKS